MCNFLTDDEFRKLCSSPFDDVVMNRMIADNKFSPTQLDLLMEGVLTQKWLFDLWPFQLLTYRGLPAYLVDTALESGRVWVVVFICANRSLTTEQIEKVLRHEDRFARESAYNNPCCTDDQKVRYHLTYGMDVNEVVYD